ncbi:MAG TPA: uracil-DNA glycosylase [Longimicrobiales bacterium]|nr:uracil-DNA glycosylase [Longimicrobiales bacterium]
MSAPRWLPRAPAGWPDLERALRTPSARALDRRLAAAAGPVYPERRCVFRALELTPLSDVRVVILGQDPYHRTGQAHGLAFSVPPGVPVPPSLGNIFRELHADLGIATPGHGDLTAWARRGVLLLNATLTVGEGDPGGHAGWGWSDVTDAVLRWVAAKPEPVVFLLWGRHARAKAPLTSGRDKICIVAPHPSPLSAFRGFLGSRCFSRANRALRERGAEGVDWSLPARPPDAAEPLATPA